MANQNLGDAKKAKNDEFYTQFHDIQAEMNAYLEYDPEVFKGKTILLPCDDPEWSNFTKYFAQNFDTLGLKKLISTSYAPDSKPREVTYQPTLFEMESPDFDESKNQSNGKIFTLSRDRTGDKVINVEDLEWSYLDGDGDFRSDEITKLRDEADLVITNPPFSLFREFLAWIIESNKGFSIIGSMNAVTYKEVFPLIRDNKIWLGRGFKGAALFASKPPIADIDANSNELVKFGNITWYTNIEHGRRHEPLVLMSEEDNKRFSRHEEIRAYGYRSYDNFEAIDVPYTDAIPSDHDGVMGVPISFLTKFNPEQFEILGITKTWDSGSGLKKKTYGKQIQVSEGGKSSEVGKLNDGGAIEVSVAPHTTHYLVDGKIYIQVYQRILIRRRERNG